ncbi:MAG TPA: hypothetical protein VH088_10970, partial [Terriglobales bacterium]|nr:hypothetical protein [Terriglobales bacterium]
MAFVATAAAQAQVTISISPTNASVLTNGTVQYAATVAGAADTSATWLVDGLAGGSAAAGTITATGFYTAPASSGPHTVTATSNADPGQSASTSVFVSATLVSINPTTANLAPAASQQFSATVSGPADTSVTWSVDNVVGGSTTTGTITASGLYTAPSATGPHTVTATSNADSTKSASATTNITNVVIAISPTSVAVPVNTTKQFAATVTGTTNKGVKWYVDGIQGGAVSTGTITTGGLYSAAPSEGTHTVTITSNADPTQSSSSAVTVTSVAVAISPTAVSLNPGVTKQFAASVTGTTNTGVKWYVDGVLGGAAASGTITTSGLYTSPASGGSHTVSIVSNADTTKSASSAVTINGVSISVNPTSAALAANGTQQFTATVTGSANTSATWSVDGVAGGSAATGTVSA